MTENRRRSINDALHSLCEQAAVAVVDPTDSLGMIEALNNAGFGVYFFNGIQISAIDNPFETERRLAAGLERRDYSVLAWER